MEKQKTRTIMSYTNKNLQIKSMLLIIALYAVTIYEKYAFRSNYCRLKIKSLSGSLKIYEFCLFLGKGIFCVHYENHALVQKAIF